MAAEDKEMEKLLSSPVRLRIIASLIARERVEFNEMIELLELTRGNLSSHIKHLEGGGYVEVIKEFVGNKPKTSYVITKKGVEKFEIYVSLLENIIASSNR